MKGKMQKQASLRRVLRLCRKTDRKIKTYYRDQYAKTFKAEANGQRWQKQDVRAKLGKICYTLDNLNN